MMRNLLDGGFNGPILPVTPNHKAVCGVLAYANIASLPITPDLAILCTHDCRNLTLLEDLGNRGCKAAIILSAAPEQFPELKACAQRHHMRLLGPNSLGLLAPWQGLNASFSPVPIKKGGWRLSPSLQPWPIRSLIGRSNGKLAFLTYCTGRQLGY